MRILCPWLCPQAVYGYCASTAHASLSASGVAHDAAAQRVTICGAPDSRFDSQRQVASGRPRPSALASRPTAPRAGGWVLPCPCSARCGLEGGSRRSQRLPKIGSDVVVSGTKSEALGLELAALHIRDREAHLLDLSTHIGLDRGTCERHGRCGPRTSRALSLSCAGKGKEGAASQSVPCLEPLRARTRSLSEVPKPFKVLEAKARRPP